MSPGNAKTTPATSASLMDTFDTVEREFGAADWRVRDVHLWPVVRVRWFFSIWAAMYGGNTAGARGSTVGAAVRQARAVLSGTFGKALAVLRDRRCTDPGTDARDAVFLSDGVSFVGIDGVQYERFCDPLITHLRSRGLGTLLVSPTHSYKGPRASPSLFVQGALDGANWCGLLGAEQIDRELELPRLAEAQQWLVERGLAAEYFSRRRIARDASRLLALERVFGRILERSGPRLAFVVSYYYLEGFAFVLACRRRRIPVVDIQHGVQGPLHPGYGRMPPPPPTGFGVVPDIFWVWSGDESDTIGAWAGGDGPHRAFIGGNPWLEMWRKGTAPSFSTIKQRAEELYHLAGGRQIALVTLQAGLSPEQQLEPLRELVVLSGRRWVWWVRLHPAMSQTPDSIRALLECESSSVEVTIPSELPLYAVLPHADVHVTHSSSTVLEAALFGLRSVITSPYGAELYPREIAEGAAVVADKGAAACLTAMASQAAGRAHVETSAPEFPASLDSLLSSCGVTAGNPR